MSDADADAPMADAGPPADVSVAPAPQLNAAGGEQEAADDSPFAAAAEKRARPDDAGAAALTLDAQPGHDCTAEAGADGGAGDADAHADADAGAADADEFAASDGWACGANASGALGTGDAAAALRPKRIRARRPWAQLALGDSHAAGISACGALYTWGLDDRGQTGHGEAGPPRLCPARVEALEGRSCVAVALGFEHSAVALSDGSVWCCGSNEYGQCGAGDGAPLAVPTPRLARLPRCPAGGVALAVVAVACGANHALALTASGAVLSWGQGFAGQLGTGDARDRHTPTLLSSLWGVPIAALAAGEAHSLAVSLTGDVYAWGRAASGALGLAEREEHAGNSGDEGDDSGAAGHSGAAGGGDAAARPVPAAVVAALLDMGIDRALAEAAAAAAAGVEAAVEWAFAHQAEGAAAAAPPTPSVVGMSRGAALLPRRVRFGVAGAGAPPTPLPAVTAIAAGASHSVLVTACGAVYTCGAGASGALGHGGSGSELLPRRVARADSHRIVAAAAGAAHTLLLAHDGALLACGAGEDGALGVKDARDKLVPVPVLAAWTPPGARVVAIAAGGFASAFVARADAEACSPLGLACPATALERALSDVDGGSGGHASANGGGVAANERALRAVVAAIDAALGSVCGAAAAFAHRPRPHASAAVAAASAIDEDDADDAPLAPPPPPPAPLIDAARLEACSVRALSLGIRFPEVVSALRGATERLVEELRANATSLRAREHAAALAVAAHSPLLSTAAPGAALLRTLCPLLACASPRVRAGLRAGWACTPAALLASRTVRPLQAFVSAEITSARATTPHVVAAIRVLALAHAANAAPSRPLAEALSADEFCNSVISDNFNVSEDFSLWVHGGAAFTFCAHAFLLSPSAKAKLLRFEAATRMHASVQASRAAAAAAAFRLPPASPRWLRFLAGEVNSPFGEDAPSQPPPPPPPPTTRPAPPPSSGEAPSPEACGMPGTHPDACVLRVRRSHLVADALSEVARQTAGDIFKPLRVHFIGEDGIDAGGLRKEFFQLLLWQLMSPAHGLFVPASDGRARWLAPDGAPGGRSDADAQAVWRLVGTLLGLAIYNGIICELHLPRAFFKKLLGERVGLDDLEAFEPELVKSMRQLLTWAGPGSVEEVFCLTFVHERLAPAGDDASAPSARVVVPLQPGGETTAVTERNRRRYVSLYAAHVLTRGCCRAFDALRAGFMALCGGRALRLVSAAELETLVCGTPHLDLRALEAAARYSGGWDATHPTVRALWSVVHTQLSLTEQKLLLRFVTGSDRAPIGGLGALSVLITREGPDSGRLPTSHTCFCQLCLPEYGSRGKLADRLRTAITNAAEGFGLT
jgi:ubiquitin-protein ligase E3 A